MTTSENPYVPKLATIEKITQETKGERAVKTFRAVFQDPKIKDTFTHKPGQTILVSVFGKGESMFAISCSPTRKGYVEFSVVRTGKVTLALHEMEVGATIGIRGPYGNGFPVEEWEGKNILFVGGGIGQAPLRSVVQYVLDKRDKFGDVKLIYGARTPDDLVFYPELEEMIERKDIDVWLSIDVDADGWFRVNWDDPWATEYDPDCRKFTGFVPMIVAVIKPSSENTIALTCGPPIMIRFVVQNLEKLGFTDEQILTTLENRMKCGIGKCGRCNVGPTYVCKDGPVYTQKQIKELPPEF